MDQCPPAPRDAPPDRGEAGRRAPGWVAVVRRGPLLLALLAGCRLVDQTTFNPHAGAPPPPPAPVAAASGPPPLVTIGFDGTDAEWEGAVARAVDAARARKPEVEFDVVSVVPAAGPPAEQLSRAEAGGGEAEKVASAITRRGVPARRVHLLARTDAAVVGRSVRVYVR